jgi:hypothetical protein
LERTLIVAARLDTQQAWSAYQEAKEALSAILERHFQHYEFAMEDLKAFHEERMERKYMQSVVESNKE